MLVHGSQPDALCPTKPDSVCRGDTLATVATAAAAAGGCCALLLGCAQQLLVSSFILAGPIVFAILAIHIILFVDVHGLL